MIELLENTFNAIGMLYSIFFAMSFFGLVAGAIVVLSKGSSRKATVIYLGLSFVPLLIGLLGTAHGYFTIQDFAADVSPAKLGLSYEMARMTTYFGGAMSLLFFCLGAVAFFRVRDERPTVTVAVESDSDSFQTNEPDDAPQADSTNPYAPPRIESTQSESGDSSDTLTPADFDQPYKVYTAATNLEAHLIAVMLQGNDLPAHVVEDQSGASLWAMGTITQFHQPNIWVDQSDAEQAAKLILAFEEERRKRRGLEQGSESPVSLDSKDELPEWTCTGCHEINPGHFQVCWNCASEQ